MWVCGFLLQGPGIVGSLDLNGIGIMEICFGLHGREQESATRRRATYTSPLKLLGMSTVRLCRNSKNSRNKPVEFLEFQNSLLECLEFLGKNQEQTIRAPPPPLRMCEAGRRGALMYENLSCAFLRASCPFCAKRIPWFKPWSSTNFKGYCNALDGMCWT